MAERYAAIRDFIEAKPEALHPVTRADHRGRARALRRRRLRRPVPPGRARARDGTGLERHRRPGRAVDPGRLHARRRRGRSGRRQFAARHLHQLRQPARPLRRSPCPGPFRERRPAGRRHADRAGRPRRAARGARRAAAPRRRRSDRRDRRAAAAARPASAAAAPAGTIEIAVVGAHLSGMALNHELTARGGSFVRAVDDRAGLSALRACPAGRRSGRAWCASANGGAAIATEVWALAAAAFGDFVAGDPAAARHRHARACRRHERRRASCARRSATEGAATSPASAAGAPISRRSRAQIPDRR